MDKDDLMTGSRSAVVGQSTHDLEFKGLNLAEVATGRKWLEKTWDLGVYSKHLIFFLTYEPAQ